MAILLNFYLKKVYDRIMLGKMCESVGGSWKGLLFSPGVTVYCDILRVTECDCHAKKCQKPKQQRKGKQRKSTGKSTAVQSNEENDSTDL